MQGSILTVYRSSDNRYRTAYYKKGPSEIFCIAERTAKGVLITEFGRNGSLINQVYLDKDDALQELKRHVSGFFDDLRIEDVGEYEKVSINALCDACNTKSVARELDFAVPALVTNVPVVQTLRCLKCGKRFYSVTRPYLKALVNGNLDLFDGGEIRQKDEDEERFINTLNEYVIRIFASKKINRLEII